MQHHGDRERSTGGSNDDDHWGLAESLVFFNEHHEQHLGTTESTGLQHLDGEHAESHGERSEHAPTFTGRLGTTDLALFVRRSRGSW